MCVSGWVAVQQGSRRTSGPCDICQPQAPPLVPQSYLMISLTPPLSSLACVAATIWCYSLYMPFAASYPVKFNCTAQCKGISCSLPSLTHTQTHCLSPAFSFHIYKYVQGIPLSHFSCIFVLETIQIFRKEVLNRIWMFQTAYRCSADNVMHGLFCCYQGNWCRPASLW